MSKSKSKKETRLNNRIINRAIPRGTVDAVDENPYTSLHRNDRDTMFCYMQSVRKLRYSLPKKKLI